MRNPPARSRGGCPRATAARQGRALELLEAVRARCIADHSTLPVERAHLVDTIASAAHSLVMVAEEGVKVKVFDSFWRDTYGWMIAGTPAPEDARRWLRDNAVDWVASALPLGPPLAKDAWSRGDPVPLRSAGAS